MADAATAVEETTLSEDEKAFAQGLGETTESATEEEGESTEGKTEGEEAEGTGSQATEESTEDGETEEGDKTEGEESEEEVPDRQNRQGYAERQARRTAVTAEVNKLVPLESKEQLIENKGLDPVEAEVEAMRQEMRRDATIRELTDLNSGLQADADNVLRDFPVFNPKSDQYDEQLTNETMELWQNAAKYQAAPENPNVAVRAEVPLYGFYAHVAKAVERGIAAGRKTGEAEGQKAAEKMLADTETAPGTTATEAVLPDEDALFLAGLTGKK